MFRLAWQLLLAAGVSSQESSSEEVTSGVATTSALPQTISGMGEGLLPFLQIDDIDSGLYDDLENVPENSCTRTCVRGDTRTCYYRFYFEPYVTMGGACGDCPNNATDCFNSGCVSADGYDRSILTINRRMPAPSIQVCEGDDIVVDVHNMMAGRSTTIHWHGHAMKDTKFMDGVPKVTQCPIEEGSTFRYSFKAENWGMYFYHSHDGLQKVDGLVGSLVIRQPKEEDPNQGEYDFDLPSHVIVVQDWHNLPADAIYPGLRSNREVQLPSRYLIKGRGQLPQTSGSTVPSTPLAEFNVTQGNRYVFRIVAGTCFACQYIFTIENHDFVIIGADVQPTQPYRVDSLTMSPGERYSVVVNANRTVDAYWIAVRTEGICSVMNASQVAVLRYEGSPDLPSTARPDHVESDATRKGLTMNPLNSPCTTESRDERGPCVKDLRNAYQPLDVITRSQPDFRIYWIWDFHNFATSELYAPSTYFKHLQTPVGVLAGTVNGITNIPSPSPLLSQPDDVPSDLLCSADLTNLTTLKESHRECIHVIQLPADSVVEIVSIGNATYNLNALSHSIHLHGYDMYMLEMGLLNQNLSLNEAIYELMDRLDTTGPQDIPAQPAFKDTFPLTAGGYAVTRIYTDNPGYWFYHCHFAYHLDTGMSGVLQVGEQGTFPDPPPNFPTCGTFTPELS